MKGAYHMKRSKFIFLSLLYFSPYFCITTVTFYFIIALFGSFFSNIPGLRTVVHLLSSVIMKNGEPKQVGVLLCVVGLLLIFAVYKWMDWPSRIAHLCTIASFSAIAVANGTSALFAMVCIFLLALLAFFVLHIRNYIRLVHREKAAHAANAGQ